MANQDSIFPPPHWMEHPQPEPDVAELLRPGTPPDDGIDWHGIFGGPPSPQPTGSPEVAPPSVADPQPTEPLNPFRRAMEALPEPVAEDEFMRAMGAEPRQFGAPDEGLPLGKPDGSSDEAFLRAMGTQPTPPPTEEERIMAGDQPPDAISGGQVSEPDASVPDLADSDSAAEPVTAQVEELRGMDPVEFAGEVAGAEAGRAQHMADRQLEEVARDAEWEQENRQFVQRVNTKAKQRLEALDQAYEELGKREIDPDRWWGSRSTGQKVAAYVSAMIGGFLGAGRRPNEGLALITQAIDRDIDAQKANLIHQRGVLGERRGIVGELYGVGKDLYVAENAARIASYERVKDQLAAERQKYDQHGTTARAIAMAERQMQGQIDQARAAAQQQAYDNALAAEKAQLERDKLTLDQGKFLEEQRRRAGSGKPKNDPRKPYRIWDNNAGDYVERQLTEDERERAVFAPGSNVVVLANTTVEARESREQMAAVNQVMDRINRINQLRQRDGWHTSITWKSLVGSEPELAQELRSMHADLKIKLNKAAKLGALDQGSLEVIEEIVGSDPAAILDKTTSRLNRLAKMVRSDAHAVLSSYDEDLPIELVAPVRFEAPPRKSWDEVSSSATTLQYGNGEAKSAEAIMGELRQGIVAMREDGDDARMQAARLRGVRDKIAKKAERLEAEQARLERKPIPDMSDEEFQQLRKVNEALGVANKVLLDIDGLIAKPAAQAKEQEEEQKRKEEERKRQTDRAQSGLPRDDVSQGGRMR